MGVFSASISESYGYGDIPELEINDYNAGALASDNFAEMAILGSVDVTAVHKSLVESLAAQEISAVEEGYEVLYEASSLESIGNKIKALIQKAIEKIKSLFEKVIAVFRSWTKRDREFIHKYSTTFNPNFNKLKKLDMKVFEYHTDVRNAVAATKDNVVAIANSIKTSIKDITIHTYDNVVTDENVSLATMMTAGSWSAMHLADATAFDTLKAKLDAVDTASENEKKRGAYFGILTGTKTANANTIGTTAGTGSLSAKEFSDKMYEYYRNESNSKDNLSLSELKSKGYDAPDIVRILSNGEKTGQQLTKYYQAIVKELKKEIETTTKSLSKDKYTGTADADKLTAAKAYFSVKYSAELSLYLECVQTWQGQFLQACKEYSRTCKSIATKVVAMGEKRLAQEESWDYEYDNDYSNGFMNSVIIK